MSTMPPAVASVKLTSAVRVRAADFLMTATRCWDGLSPAELALYHDLTWDFSNDAEVTVPRPLADIEADQAAFNARHEPPAPATDLLTEEAIVEALEPTGAELDALVEAQAEREYGGPADPSEWDDSADNWFHESDEERLTVTEFLEAEVRRYRSMGTDIAALLAGAVANVLAEARAVGATTAADIIDAREAEADELARDEDERELAWRLGYESGALTHCM